MTAVFITATGTEIGKTFVAAGLLACLRRRGRAVAALKPVLSGFDAAHAAASDAAVLLEACGQTADLAAIASVSPWRFAAPLSPDMAARMEGKAIDVAEVVRFCTDALATAEDVLLIEGIGGLMVPLTGNATVCDLVAALRIPAILVAGSYLGTLSHTLTALEVARKRGLEIAALVLNETPDSAVPLEATRDSLAQFCGGIPIVGLPRDPAGHAAAFNRLADFVPPRAASVA